MAGTIVQGTLDGDSAVDPNLVENVEVTTGSFNGVVPWLDPIHTAPDETFAFFPNSNTVSFDGSGMDLAVFASTFSGGPFCCASLPKATNSPSCPAWWGTSSTRCSRPTAGS